MHMQFQIIKIINLVLLHVKSDKWVWVPLCMQFTFLMMIYIVRSKLFSVECSKKVQKITTAPILITVWMEALVGKKTPTINLVTFSFRIRLYAHSTPTIIPTTFRLLNSNFKCNRKLKTSKQFFSQIRNN